jgi:uncharacterized membrane protein
MTRSEDKQTGYWLLIALCASVVVVYFVYWSWVKFAMPDPDDRGVFGDMFGGLSALFNALAFSGLIFTAILQRKELELQREELGKQREAIELQAFESMFFQLIRLHHDIVAAIRISSHGPDGDAVGRESFKRFRHLIDLKYQNHAPKELHAEEDLRAVRSGYQSAYRICQAQFGHYFRNLYHIVKFVHESDAKDKHRYTALIRAQLSTDELCCLFYNCISSEGAEKFKPLAEEYALFNNLPRTELIREYHAEYVSKTAFER